MGARRGKQRSPGTTHFGVWLSNAIDECELGIREIADIADISHVRIYQYISQGQDPPKDVIDRLARALIPSNLDRGEADEERIILERRRTDPIARTMINRALNLPDDFGSKLKLVTTPTVPDLVAVDPETGEPTHRAYRIAAYGGPGSVSKRVDVALESDEIDDELVALDEEIA